MTSKGQARVQKFKKQKSKYSILNIDTGHACTGRVSTPNGRWCLVGESFVYNIIHKINQIHGVPRDTNEWIRNRTQNMARRCNVLIMNIRV